MRFRIPRFITTRRSRDETRRNSALARGRKQLRADTFGLEKTAQLSEGELIRISYSHKYNDVKRARLFVMAGATVLKEWSQY